MAILPLHNGTSSEMRNTWLIVFKLVTIITVWLLLIVALVRHLPPDPNIKIPHSLSDVKLLSNALRLYSEKQSILVLSVFSLVFLFKQCWGIPGALLLNVLAGTVYGITALPLCNLLAATGSSMAYIISQKLIGQMIIGTCIPKASVRAFKSKVDENAHHLLWYMTSIRIIPAAPGWLVNLVSPFIGIPLYNYNNLERHSSSLHLLD